MNSPRLATIASLGLCLALCAPALAYVNVGGGITTNTTWGRTAPATDGIYWVTSSVTVSNGATLTIEPGVIVKFAASTRLTIGGTGGATLTALGTTAEPIRFTSIKDDLRADTNGDGTATSPAAGDWQRIQFSPGGGGRITDAEIFYAGQSYNHALNCFSSAPSELSRTTIAWSKAIGLECAAGYCPATISANTFRNNGTWPVKVGPSEAKAIAVDNTFTANLNQGVQISGTTLGAGTHTWAALPVAWVPSGDLLVPAGATLNLGPGVVVKLGSLTGFSVNGGTLNAQGAIGQPVVFTSTKDDVALGDANGDGTASVPAAGDWQRLFFQSSGGGILDFVELRYAGQSYYYGLQFFSGKPTALTNSVIRNNLQYGLEISAGYCPATVSGNTFSNNGTWPVRIFPSDAKNLSGDNVFLGNKNNGVYLQSQTMAAGTHTWAVLPVPWYPSGDIVVPAGATLNLSAGLVMKIGGLSQLNVNGGTLNTLGTGEQRVILTSGKDDTLLGDTNGDGTATFPAAGDWQRILFQGSTNSGSLSGLEVRYAGGSYTGAINCHAGCFASMNLSTVHDNAGGGLEVRWASAAPAITRSTFRDNAKGIIVTAGAPVIGGTAGQACDILENTDYGVQNTSSACVNARGNYWGSTSGPNDPSAAADTCGLGANAGTGDKVTDNVDYTGYIGSPNTPPDPPTPLSPASPSEVASSRPTLTVTNSPSTGTLDYHFQVARNQTFTLGLQEGTVTEGTSTTSWTVPSALMENTTYYWRCRAKDRDTTLPSAWTEIWRFFVNAANDPPRAPSPRDPDNGSRVDTKNPTLTVNNTTDPDDNETWDVPLTYQFAVYADEDLTSLVESQGNLPEGSSTTSYTVVTTLSENTEYWWRSRARDGVQDGVWSAAIRFFVNTTNEAGPAAPTLSSPAEGAETGTLTPMLRVNNPADPDRDPLVYSFRVYTAPNLTGLVASTNSVNGNCCNGTTSWTVTPALERSRWHWWTSDARDNSFTGPNMATASFFSAGFPMPEATAHGYLPSLGGDTVRGDKVGYTAAGQTGDVFLVYEVFNIAAGQEHQYRVTVNGTNLGIQGPAVAGAWSYPRWTAVPDAVFNNSDPNAVNFTCGLNAPASPAVEWGVRQVRIGLPPPEPARGQAFNTVVDISWSPVPGTSGVNLYRSATPGGPYTKLNTSPLPGNLYRDINLANGTTYYYLLRSVSMAGTEGFDSHEIAATPTTAGGVTPVTDLRVAPNGNHIRLSWTNITTSGGVKNYKVYSVSPSSVPPYTRAGAPVLGSPAGSPFDHLNAYPTGTMYWYDVATVNNSNQEASY